MPAGSFCLLDMHRFCNRDVLEVGQAKSWSNSEQFRVSSAVQTAQSGFQFNAQLAEIPLAGRVRPADKQVIPTCTSAQCQNFPGDGSQAPFRPISGNGVPKLF